MSSKKKKGGKADAPVASEKPNEVKMTPELYELKIKDLTEKMEYWKGRSSDSTDQFSQQSRAMEELAKDKNDVIEYLRLQVLQGERNQAELRQLVSQIETERDQIREQIINEKNLEMLNTKTELLEMTSACNRYKSELDQLAEFRKRKDQMEKQLGELSKAVEAKDKECKEIIHNMERKTIQDKSILRNEMISKVNEVVSSFRNLSDQQMAETTKRTIQENIVVTSQLQKLSAKIVELLDENKKLQELQRINKQHIDLANSNESEFAKRTQSYRKVVKLLTKRIEELEGVIDRLKMQPEQKNAMQTNEPLIEEAAVEEIRQSINSLAVPMLTEVVRFILDMMLDEQLPRKVDQLPWLDDLAEYLNSNKSLEGITLNGIHMMTVDDVLDYIMNEYEAVELAPEEPLVAEVKEPTFVAETESQQKKAYLNQRQNGPPFKNLPKGVVLPEVKSDKSKTIAIQTTHKLIDPSTMFAEFKPWVNREV